MLSQCFDMKKPKELKMFLRGLLLFSVIIACTVILSTFSSPVASKDNLVLPTTASPLDSTGMIPHAHLLPEFRRLKRKMRLLQRLYASRHTDHPLFRQIVKDTVPWLTESFSKILHNDGRAEGRGIVMSFASKHFPMALPFLYSLRNVLHCDLPVEVFYMGESDLSQEHIGVLRNAIKDIQVLDIFSVFPGIQIKGWNVKPLAMLASSFQSVIFIDADAVFVRDPSVLFETEEFISTGSVFFYDRSSSFNNHGALVKSARFIQELIPQRLHEHNRYFVGSSEHVQESGVVVVDKSRALVGLLAACYLNIGSTGEYVTTKMFYGDKETFWFGFEISKTPHSFMDLYGGSVGYAISKNGQEGVCGRQLAHADSTGLLWFNEGVYVDDFTDASGTKYIKPDAYMMDSVGKPEVWIPNHYPDCISYKEGKAKMLSESEIYIIQKIIENNRKYNELLTKFS